METRSATNSDRPAIEALVFGVLAEYGLVHDPIGVDSDLANIETNYIARGGSFDVLIDDAGAIVGTIGLYPEGHGVCELRKMYLAKEHRGGGRGRALLEHAIARARALGFRRIELETNSRLVEAIRLYTRYGFQAVANTGLAARCDQRYALDLN
jgi:putative acetyltransferase